MATETVLRATAASAVRGRIPAVDQFYVTAADNFRVTVNVRFLTTVTVNLSWRLLRDDDGRVQVAQTSKVLFPGGDPEVFTVKLDQGVLLNAQLWVDVVAGLRYGIVYGRVEIVRGFDGALTSLATVIQGYLTNATPIGWPGSPLQAMHEGAGAIVSPAWSPGSGPLSASLVVPQNVRWRVICGCVLFSASGAAGTRFQALAVLDPTGGIVFDSPIFTGITAGGAQFLSFGAGLPINDLGVVNNRHWAFPNDVELAASSLVKISVVGEQAGDALTGQSAIVREWMDR